MQITLLEHIVYADGSNVPVTVGINHEGCAVQLRENTVSLTWDQMADVEHLSNVFEDVTVREFKVIVEMLGKVYANKDVYIATVSKT